MARGRCSLDTWHARLLVRFVHEQGREVAALVPIPTETFVHHSGLSGISFGLRSCIGVQQPVYGTGFSVPTTLSRCYSYLRVLCCRT